jgi:hypothetical protein
MASLQADNKRRRFSVAELGKRSGRLVQYVQLPMRLRYQAVKTKYRPAASATGISC